MNPETRPANTNRRMVPEIAKSELVAFMSDNSQDFSDFAHRCV